MKQELLNISQAAKILNLSPRTIYRLTTSKSLSYVRGGQGKSRGSKLMFTREDLQRYIEQKREMSHYDSVKDIKNTVVSDQILKLFLNDLGLIPFDVNGELRLTAFDCFNCHLYIRRINAGSEAKCNGKQYGSDTCRKDFKPVNTEPGEWVNRLFDAYRGSQ